MTLHETPLNYPPYQFHVELMVGDHSPCFMRRAAKRYLDMWELPHLAEGVTLALTELLTNVHRHVPGRWCTSTVIRTLNGVRIEVYDRSPELPALPAPDPLSESGRGLSLIGLCTDAWGVIAHRTGKTVWCEVNT